MGVIVGGRYECVGAKLRLSVMLLLRRGVGLDCRWWLLGYSLVGSYIAV